MEKVKKIISEGVLRALAMNPGEANMLLELEKSIAQAKAVFLPKEFEELMKRFKGNRIKIEEETNYYLKNCKPSWK